QQGLRNRGVSDAQCSDFRAIAIVLPLSKGYEAQKAVRDSTAGREDDAQPLGRQGIENGCYTTEAIGVGDARSSELVHNPGFGRSLMNCHRIWGSVTERRCDCTDALERTQMLRPRFPSGLA